MLVGMRKKPLLCPHCSSKKIVKNGSHHQGKIQFFCHSCSRYFYEDSARGYPPTKIPFPVIAYFLYYRRKIPEFQNMRIFKSFVNQWLRCLGIRDNDIERHTIRHWVKNYEKKFDKIISFKESRIYFHGLLSEVIRDVPKDIRSNKIISHKDTLQVLENKFGKEYCIDLINKDSDFFNELCDIFNKHRVYCWRFSDKDWLNRVNRHFLARS